jgi:beta-glucosidase
VFRLSRRATAAVACVVLAVMAAVTGSGTVAVAATALPTPCPSPTAHPWCDRSLSADARASLLQKAMTQDEEITLVGGNGNGAAPHTGATYAIPRLGLPAVFFSDGPVGPRQGPATAMPIPMALAAAWDPALAYAHGQEIADEAKRKGNDVVFAPTVNIMRTPQGGRTYEAYGEETYLVAQTGRGWIQGAQSTGVIADVKHYLANNQEGQNGVPPLTSVNGGRQVVDAQVDERTLREVYMPHFEAAVKQANVGTIMCSYNRVNGTYACENPHTLQQVLEKEWGFRGVVLADYGASKDTVGNLNNGLDFVPDQGQADQSYDPHLIAAALATGQVSRATLDGHVLRILRTLFAYGWFDRPGYAIDETAIDVKAHERTAQAIEERAITLLKNQGVLPLKPGVRKIAVVGPYADQFVTGGGSGDVTARSVVTALRGIRTRAGSGITVTYADGSDAAAAAALAKAADVAVVVVGDVQTEGQDKDCIGLNCTNDLANSESVLVLQGKTCGQVSCPLNGTNEDGLITAVAAAQRQTVVVLETGGPVLTPWRNQVAAVVEAWYPGQQGGTALARVLFGDVDPGGRLPATFPDSASQLPTAGSPQQYPGVAEQETYSEGLLVGYRWYDARQLTPAYPFGAGLSYTTFRYGPLAVRAATGPNQVAVATMQITNTGRRAGIAVPQLYVSKPATAALSQPVRQLVGYRSVPVPAGRTVQVSFPLNDRSFASWDVASGAAGGWRVLPGCYRLAAGSSSRSLPSRATVARGAACTGAAARLGTTGDVRLPLPALASVRHVPAAPQPARLVAPPAPGGSLPTTGGTPAAALLAAAVLIAAGTVRRTGSRRGSAPPR